jgi:hypothetical protein
MKKRRSSLKSRRAAKGPTLGRDRFARISEVEGIALTSFMKERAAKFERMGLSAGERRRSIIRAYSKG